MPSFGLQRLLLTCDTHKLIQEHTYTHKTFKIFLKEKQNQQTFNQYPSLLSVAVKNTMTKVTRGRKGLIDLHICYLSIIEGSQGRNHKGVLHTSLLPIAYSICRHIQPRITFPRLSLPQWTESSYINYLSRECPQANLMETTSQLVSSSQITQFVSSSQMYNQHNWPLTNMKHIHITIKP